MHALVIENNFLIATQIEDDLSPLGYTSCEIVDTKAAAIEAARLRCPDLITADDRLNDGTGLAAVEAICADQIISVVFIVGDSASLGPPLSYSSIVGKPFGGRRLREAVAEAIARAAEARVEAPARAACSASGPA